MHIPTLGEAELLVPLHEGVFEQPLWSTFLRRLQRETRSETVTFALLPEGSEAIVLGGAEREPTYQPTEGLRDGRAYAGPEIGLAEDVRIVGWKQDEALSCELLVRGNALASSAPALLGALVPHLKSAVRVFAALEQERGRTSVKEEALRRMNFGWILLDLKCRIIEHDEQAGENLARSGLLRRGPYDRLIPASAEADRKLTRHVAACAADPDARPRTINLSRDPWVDILVSPYRVEALTAGKDAVAAVYLRGDRTSSADRHDQLVEVFQLTPSEARLAWSMAQGLSIAEAAAEHGLTVETARNYSKKIYAKTGARGQADLVRHVLTSVLAIA